MQNKNIFYTKKLTTAKMLIFIRKYQNVNKSSDELAMLKL